MKESILESERLLFREFQPEDAPALHALYCDPELMRYIRPYSRTVAEEARNIQEVHINQHYQQDGYGLWATFLKSGGEMMGTCGLIRRDNLDGKREVEVAYLIAQSHWGKGLATEAARSLIQYGTQTLKLSRLVATIEIENLASIAVAKKAGMKLEKELKNDGKHVLLYAIGTARTTGFFTE